MPESDIVQRAPALVSPNDVADAIAQASGTRIKYSNIPESMFLKALVALKPPMYSQAIVTQLNIYTKEYQHGAFAVGGPTSVVEDVGSKAPESIEAIARDMVATRPEAIKMLSNRAKAMQNFLRILITPKPDIKQWSDELNHVQIEDARMTLDNPLWQASHT